MNDEPTIGDVLLAIANLETKFEARLDKLEAKIANSLTELAVLFARHLLEGHHELP